MSLKKTFMLSLLLAIAGAYIYFVELPAGEQQEKKDQLFAYLTERRVAEVSVRRGAESFVLKNLKAESGLTSNVSDDVSPSKEQETSGKGANWQYGAIQGAELDDGALTSLTSAIVGLKVGEPLPAADVDKDLKVYGLQTPELELSVRSVKKDGSPLNLDLLFGKKNDFVKLRYLQVKDGIAQESQSKEGQSSVEAAPRIFLVPEALFISANRAGSDFRKKSFVSFLDADISSASFASGESSYAIDADAPSEAASGDVAAAAPLKRSKWALRDAASTAAGQKGERRASEEGVASILRELRNAKASSFIDGDEASDPKKFGLLEGAQSLTLSYRQQEKAPLVIRMASVKKKDAFGRGPGTYVGVSGVSTIFFVDGDLSTKIFKTAVELRDRQLFRFDTAQAQKIDALLIGGESLSLVKGVTWGLVGAQGASIPADETFVSQYLTDLASLRADGFPDESRDFGFGAPVGKVSIALNAEETTKATLILGAEIVNGARFAGILVGEKGSVTESSVLEPFVLSAEQIVKVLPRRDALLPAPTPAPEEAFPAESLPPAVPEAGSLPEIVEESNAQASQ